MNPQQLHDAWLVVTAITTLTICGIALFLLATFRRSEKRWFFWALAIAFISIAIEQFCAEVKNYYQVEPSGVDVEMLKLWLGGRVQEAIVTAGALGYMIFGRNGKHKTETT